MRSIARCRGKSAGNGGQQQGNGNPWPEMVKPTTSSGPSVAESSPITRFFRATEIDTRLLGMIGALVIIWIGFHIITGGLFLTPRNLWNLSVQTTDIAIMTTGMVLIIVTRNIDLSVGSVLGLCGMVMGVTQAKILPELIGFDSPFTWVITLLVGIIAGGLIGAFQGVIIAFLNVPSFIVTLGGLLVWRGATWLVTSGQTVAPMNQTFRIMGGGAEGSIGATWSWVVGIVACLFVIGSIVNSRHQRKRFGFPRRPVWAEYFLSGLSCVLILGAIWIANSYYWPINIAKKYAEANNIPGPKPASTSPTASPCRC
jgi:D-xylose transport system permease protein